ncbi:hypothetical protein LTR64_004708 [Lithohypha guttulata]|nr:hypothetical protein LTR51_005994 [Lithohypha guttulata]
MPIRMSRLPTHAEITNFLETFLPPQVNANDVAFLYHTPRHPAYSPTEVKTARVIFSITPTPGFYTSLNEQGVRFPPSFDAHLTVGWNVALAKRLGVQVEDAVCIQGYKEDPERKIGLVAKFEQAVSLDSIVQMIQREFAGVGEVFRNDASNDKEDDNAVRDDVSHEHPIKVLAVMNAFHAEEVDRVLEATRAANWTHGEVTGKQILYLTGAAREHGLEATKQANMPVVCVGHRACEEWGIRYLAEETRKRWPDIEVIEVLEEEEPRPKRVKLQSGEVAGSQPAKSGNEVHG